MGVDAHTVINDQINVNLVIPKNQPKGSKIGSGTRSWNPLAFPVYPPILGPFPVFMKFIFEHAKINSYMNFQISRNK